MTNEPIKKPNLLQTIPFFRIANMEASLRFYTDGLGFEIQQKWIPENKIEWCSLQWEGVDLMLQEFRKEGPHAFAPEAKLGLGVSIVFICEDALAIYREVTARGIQASEPFVGNGMWVTSLNDPDGYILEFESKTDVPEETTLSAWLKIK